MAKSKKALKALKRRKEAKKRSRALKERQDYTGGGRVKAFTGINIAQGQIEAARKAAEDYQKQQQTQANPNTDDTNALAEAERKKAAEEEAAKKAAADAKALADAESAKAARIAKLQAQGTSGMDTDGDGIISTAERNKAIGVAPSKTP